MSTPLPTSPTRFHRSTAPPPLPFPPASPSSSRKRPNTSQSFRRRDSTASTARHVSPVKRFISPNSPYNRRRHTNPAVSLPHFNLADDDFEHEDSSGELPEAEGLLQLTRPHSTPSLSQNNQSHYSTRPQSSYLTSRQSRESLFQLKPSSFISSTDLSPATREINTVMNQWVHKNRILDVGINDDDDHGVQNQDGIQTLASGAADDSVDSDIDKLLKSKNTASDNNAGKRSKNTSGGTAAKRRTSSHNNSSYSSRQSVEQRIEKIRTDQLAKKRLMARVAEHEAVLRKQRTEKIPHTNSIRKYVEKVSTDYSYETIQREKKENLEKWNQLHHTVLENHERQQMHLKQHLEEVWVEGVRKREYAEFKRLLLPTLKRNEKRQKMWYPTVILASAMSKWSRIMLEKRIEREYLRKRERAKAIVKKYVLPQVFERRAQRREQAIEVLKTNMLLWSLGHRVRKKKSAVRVIVSCIGSLQDSNRFSKQVAIFLHHVKTSQKAMKKHLEKRNGQLAILRKYWDNVEAEFLVQQRRVDQDEYREKLIMEVETLLATIEGDSQEASKAQSVKESMKKTKVVVIQSKKILKKACDSILSKEETKKQLKANADTLLEKLRTKGEVSGAQLDKLGKVLSVFKRERFAVSPHIRDQLIMQDIIKRSKTHRENVANEMRKLANQEKEVRPVRERLNMEARDDEEDSGDDSGNDMYSASGSSKSKPNKDEPEEVHEEFYFKLLPPSRVLYENLILQAQQLSKEEVQKKAEMTAEEQAVQDELDMEAEAGLPLTGAEDTGDDANGAADQGGAGSESASTRPTSAKSTLSSHRAGSTLSSTIASSSASVVPPVSKGLDKVAGSLDKKTSQMMRKGGKSDSPRLNGRKTK